MECLKVRNWEKWQTYRKDRGQPPWIKIHRRLMRNIEWVSLSDAERGQLISIWLLAADSDGNVPSNPTLLQKLCFMSSTPNIKKFIGLSFLTPGGCQCDDMVSAPLSQDDQPKAKAKAEAEADKGTVTPHKKNEFRRWMNGFDKFWEAYPRKQGKGKARDSWKKISSIDLGTILSAIHKHKQTEQWKKDGGQFIPYPATWLNQERWTDEITTGGVSSNGSQNNGFRPAPVIDGERYQPSKEELDSVRVLTKSIGSGGGSGNPEDQEDRVNKLKDQADQIQR